MSRKPDFGCDVVCIVGLVAKLSKQCPFYVVGVVFGNSHLKSILDACCRLPTIISREEAQVKVRCRDIRVACCCTKAKSCGSAICLNFSKVNLTQETEVLRPTRNGKTRTECRVLRD